MYTHYTHTHDTYYINLYHLHTMYTHYTHTHLHTAYTHYTHTHDTQYIYISFTQSIIYLT